MDIKDRITTLRIPSRVSIVAATKKRTVAEIRRVLDAGITKIGENYVQEAAKKFPSLPPCEKHLIGHLQSNKVKQAVKLFDWIQTIDSKEIADAVDKECCLVGKRMPVLIEVNIGKEKNKHGCMPEEVIALADYVANLEHLELRGLMTMAPYFNDVKKTRPYFKTTKSLFDKLPMYDLLSMGMSHSYRLAVEEGATMIRLGTALFGGR